MKKLIVFATVLGLILFSGMQSRAQQFQNPYDYNYQYAPPQPVQPPPPQIIPTPNFGGDFDRLQSPPAFRNPRA